ncbi:stabilizer of axonemal microtubules 4 [Ciona intestinalis]
MVKLRTGPVTNHIKVSHGGDTHVNKFYHTRYGTEFGWQNYKPRTGRHVGTGYSSNFRPQIYYTRSLDNFDNPVMGFLLTDNYETVTKRHFREAKDSDGKDELPSVVVNKQESGFIRERPLTVPTMAEVRKTFYDKRLYGGNSRPGLVPRHRALLHKIQPKDPVEQENNEHGPAYMRSETFSKFLGEPTASLDVHYKDVGPNEDSGFTHNKNIEPITFREDDDHKNIISGSQTDRPTGVSVTDTSFNPWFDANGREPLPSITQRSSHETGFVREKSRELYSCKNPRKAFTGIREVPPLVAERIKKKDPAEYLNLLHPHNKKSVTFATYLGKQKMDQSEEELLNRDKMGDQELTGHCRNNDRYLETEDTDPQRYLTNYNLRHFDMNPEGKDREGWVMGGVQNAEEDGYCRDFCVHSMGRVEDMTRKLQRLQPYVARSIKKRDTFFVDHTHQHKVTIDPPRPPNKAPLTIATLSS